MKAAVRFHSRSGNTKMLAEAVAGTIGAEAKTIAEPMAEHVDVLFLGASVYAGRADGVVLDFIRANADKIGKIAVFGSSALKVTARSSVKAVAEDCGVKVMEEEFSCRGSFMFLHRGRPDADDAKAAAEFAKNAVNA